MNASFKQIYSLNLFIAFKMAYLFLLFWLRGKSRFSRIPLKKVYNINYWSKATLARADFHLQQFHFNFYLPNNVKKIKKCSYTWKWTTLGHPKCLKPTHFGLIMILLLTIKLLSVIIWRFILAQVVSYCIYDMSRH